MMKHKIQELKDLIQQSKKIVFFGGAGVSTESGIPDFRSADGLYNTKDVQFENYEPEYLLSHSCLWKQPKVFFEFYRQKLDCRKSMPNITHYKLAEWKDNGKDVAIVTQNIDGLHQRAGSDIVYEIHGTIMKNYCSRCGVPYHANFIFDTKSDVPKCECGGIIRPAVTLYEEQLPEDAWEGASYAIHNADLLIIAGTSMSVYPAAGLVNAASKDCKIVVINRDPIPCKADLVIQANLGEVFSQL